MHGVTMKFIGEDVSFSVFFCSKTQ